MFAASLPPFRAHFWLPTGHLQTWAGAYLPGIAVPYRAQHYVVDLDDGDRVVVHDDRPSGWQQGDRVALLVHGLGGSHRSGCVERTAHKLNQRGVRTFRLDLRGCGAGEQLALRPCHAGQSEDVLATLRWLAEFCPQSPVTLLGFSMGGNIVLKALGEAAREPAGNLDSGAAVAPPIDLAASCDFIGSGWNQIYDRYFARLCLEQTVLRRRNNPLFAKLPLSPPPMRLRDFDDRVTAPLAGYASAAEYYARASSAAHLERIEVPTFVLSAADDPAVPIEMFHRIPKSPAVEFCLTESGGHLGYIGVEGVDADCRWAEWRLVDWVLHNDRRRARPWAAAGPPPAAAAPTAALAVP